MTTRVRCPWDTHNEAAICSAVQRRHVKMWIAGWYNLAIDTLARGRWKLSIVKRQKQRELEKDCMLHRGCGMEVVVFSTHLRVFIYGIMHKANSPTPVSNLLSMPNHTERVKSTTTMSMVISKTNTKQTFH